MKILIILFFIALSSNSYSNEKNYLISKQDKYCSFSGEIEKLPGLSLFDKCFDVNHNFNLFKNRVAPFIQVLFILKNFEMRFFLAVLVVLSNKSRESLD